MKKSQLFLIIKKALRYLVWVKSIYYYENVY